MGILQMDLQRICKYSTYNLKASVFIMSFLLMFLYFFSSSCWLKNDIAFYVAVVAYFCIIFVLNLSMFVVVMVHLRRIKRQNPHNNQYRSSLHDLRSIAGLTFLLGLTWGFAFFAWGPVKLAFMYLFSILNSLQGEKQYYIICFM